ncbi:hypothetical protein AN944_02401 [Shewanella sp. P1-14-1]|uniref:DUF2971 domain-containing protein n=1 Tax=Shewanella sp. P1-14-1 TaxID=1723761 RepID=UPI0006D68E9C|nr:DUF2971 domain-containing protein [Shewanella sp. P1-14-1]KPZ70329.1 hypothetical protein AN944_02401 [Shewanella sp. P1-14-1]
MIYYKYRSLDKIKFLLDIFLNQRLYAAPYTSMNDPMEGHYFHRSGKLSPEFKSALKGKKDSYGIVSLSEVNDNALMWAHYANGHNGIAIGIEISSPNYEIVPIKYDGLSHLTQKFEHEPAEAAKRILSHKLEIWDYEKEHRVFVQHEKFVPVKIKEVIFGRRVSPHDKEFFEKLIKKLCGSEIQIKSENA